MGALVSFIQKGFQYMEIEANLNEVGAAVWWACEGGMGCVVRRPR